LLPCAITVKSSPVLAYYLHHATPIIVDFHGIALRWYGLAYVLGFLFGYYLYVWLARQGYTDMKPDMVQDFITWAAIFGVMLGGRLGWVIFYGWDKIKADPLSALKVWEGGMSSHGGILGLVLFTLYYSLRHRLSWTSIGDSLVVVAPIGLFLVRIANFVNGELWGRPATVPWAVQFPTELPDPVRQGLDEAALRLRLPPRHPSQLYEAMLEGVLLFLLLWILRTRMRLPRGVVTGAFFILYAILRIIGEMFREPDPAWSVGPFSAGQFLSLFMILIGMAFILWGFKARQYEKVFLPADPGDRSPAA
jgi:phosphatidylglycerol:prolipoprotein diacylglycerol transferase